MKKTETLAEKLSAKNLELEAERDDLIKRIIQKDEEIKLLKKLAMIDPISMIYNLNYVNTEVERIKAIKVRELERVAEGIFENKPEYVFMFFIDIDGLKAINNTYGHAAGNATIRKMGSILTSIVRRCDIAAHLHGDEFVAIIMTKDRKEGRRFKKRVLKAIRSIALEEYGITFSASAGFRSAILNPKFSFTDLMLKADAKMYEMKNEKSKNK